MKSFTVAKMALESGLSAHTLRYYEKELLLLEVPRDAGGRRLYTENHLLAVRFISALRSTSMPVALIKQYMSLYRKGPQTASQRLQLLESHECKVKKQLDEIRSSLKLVRKKISHYKRELA
jgi:DNA-binding transcriptional MerR regulator